MIIPNNQMPCFYLFSKNLMNKFTGFHITEILIEINNNKMINPCFPEKSGFLIYCGKERESFVIMLQDKPRMRIECDNYRFAFLFTCPQNKSIKKRPVSPVNPVKNAECHNRRNKIKIFISLMNDHRRRL